MSPLFTFIVDPIQGQSYRKGELLSIINSHVATVMHARKETVSARQGKRKKKKPGASFPSLKRHWSAEDASMSFFHRQVSVLKSADSDYRTTVVQSQRFADRQLCSLDKQLVSVLDPFLQLPIDLMSDEMKMLQFCKYRTLILALHTLTICISSRRSKASIWHNFTASVLPDFFFRKRTSFEQHYPRSRSPLDCRICTPCTRGIFRDFLPKTCAGVPSHA